MNRNEVALSIREYLMGADLAKYQNDGDALAHLSEGLLLQLERSGLIFCEHNEGCQECTQEDLLDSVKRLGW